MASPETILVPILVSTGSATISTSGTVTASPWTFTYGRTTSYGTTGPLPLRPKPRKKLKYGDVVHDMKGHKFMVVGRSADVANYDWDVTPLDRPYYRTDPGDVLGFEDDELRRVR